MSPALQAVPGRVFQDDFSGMLRSRLSSLGLSTAPKYVRDAINAVFRPKRAFTIRKGSRDTSTNALPQKPNSMGKHYHVSGNRVFVATDNGAGGGNIYRHTSSSDTLQTLPWSPTDKKWRLEPANGILVGTQIANVNPPIFWSVTNAADTWLSLVVPKPVAAPTFNADSAGGFKTVGKTYFYRYRYRYANGASLASPVSAGRPIASPNQTINVVIPLPGSPRTDYLGWTLEGTDQNGSVNGPWYFIAIGTAASQADGNADSDLNVATDETLHGEPLAMDGVISHKDRLFGWRGSSLFFSQPVIGEEGTGIANWVGDAIEYVDKDDGDAITEVIHQGDRLLIGKRNSVHVLDGIDVDSFILRRIYDGAGIVGPRAACSVGPTVFFYGGYGRFFVAQGDSVRPVWGEELGEQALAMDPTYDADVLAVNFRGEQVLFWHRRIDSTSQRDVIGYDLLFGGAIRYQDPPAIDALVQKDEADFSNAKILLADPTLRSPAQTTSPSVNPSFYSMRIFPGGNHEVYVQSLDSNGAVRWGAGGILVSQSIGNTITYHAICGDGVGGIYVAFEDNRGGTHRDTYIQRYNAAGSPIFAAGGILLQAGVGGGSPSGNGRVAICSDGANGAIATWCSSLPSGFSGDAADTVYAQRVDPSGAKLWNAGVAIKVFDRAASGSGAIAGVNIRPYGASGCWIIADNANTTAGQRHARLNSAGAALGTANGDYTASVVDNVSLPMARGDSDSLYIATYASNSSGIVVKKLLSTGATAWSTNVTLGRFISDSPVLVPDGTGGVWLMWRDQTNTLVVGTRAQHLSSAGAVLLAAGGVPLMTANSAASLGQGYGVPDGSGGAIFSWHNFATSAQPYTQRIDSLGIIRWGPDGILLFPSVLNVTAPIPITDGLGGAIFIAFSSTVSRLIANRIKSDQTTPWGLNGVSPVVSAASQDLYRAVFTDTPEGEYPPGAVAGYHIWAGFDGVTDFADATGANGIGINVMVKSHRYDFGRPQSTKDANWFEINIDKGAGTFSITVEGDEGRISTFTLKTSAQSLKYNSGAKYNTGGAKYKTTGATRIDTGLPANTEGRGLTVTFAGAFTTELQVAGWTIDAMVLPQKEYS